MSSYIIRRIILLIPVLTSVALVGFLVTHSMPGDPVQLMLGDFASPERIAAVRHQLGYDRPLYTQFWIYATNLARGDLGQSLYLERSVNRAILEHLEPTMLLAFQGQLIGIVLAIPLGIIAAVKHRTWVDYSAIVGSLLGISMPSFLLAIILILIFGVKLGWFPAVGYIPLSNAGIGVVKFLSLPSVTLGLIQAGLIARMTRSSMLDVLRKDYIRTARAKGLREKVVVYKHALKNALIPTATVIGLSFADLLGGTFVIETIFNIPGTGLMAITAIYRRDYPLIQGSLMFVAGVYVFVNLLVDIVYAFLDPRIKYQ